MVQMTHRADVAVELNVTAEQKAKLDALEDAMQTEVSNVMSAPSDDPDETRNRISDVGNKCAADLKQILTPRQYGRLREILFQKAGYGAVLRRDVQDELALDAGQKKGVDEAEAGMLQKFDELRSASLAPAEMRATMMQTIGARDKAIEDLLTPRQKAQFFRMKGKPFKFEDPK